MNSIQSTMTRIRSWLRRRTLPQGRVLSRFLAHDIRRDILIVSSERIDEGIITGRVRTSNLLYVSKGLAPQPEFEAARELRIDEMWRWTGQSWGGMPDGNSIADGLRGPRPD